MLAVLAPLLAWLAFCLLFYKRLQVYSDTAPCWRTSFLAASVAWGALLVAFTEALSAFHLLTRVWILSLWLLATLALLAASWKLPSITKPLIPSRQHISGSQTLLLGAIAAIVVTTGVIAWVAPPNTYDSMTYHMGRVVHWLQNRSVAHYPTHIDRQLWLNPGAEFIIAHLQALANGDRFANLVQWFAMLGSVIGASALAREIGARSRGQILAAVLTATIPMGILQASSTQNDYVVSYWLICFVYFYLLATKLQGWTFPTLAGISLGLSLLTKSTAYLYGFPFFLILSLILWKKKGLAHACKVAILILFIAITLNSGHYFRNQQLYGNPLRPANVNSYLVNQSISPRLITSNAVKNIGLHLYVKEPLLSKFLGNALETFHHLIRIPIDDPRTTFGNKAIIPLTREEWYNFAFFNEDFAGNLAHLVLIFISIILAIWKLLVKRQKSNYNIAWYPLALALGFLFFVSYLKWQPWHSRLHLPLFVLSSPLIALILSRTLPREITYAIAIVFILLSYPWIFKNYSRPIIAENSIFSVDRTEQYFVGNQEETNIYTNIADTIKSRNCRNIGLIIGLDDKEYPYWILLNNKSTQPYKITHVNVTNENSLPSPTLNASNAPCALVSRFDKEEDILVDGVWYTRFLTTTDFAQVYVTK